MPLRLSRWIVLIFALGSCSLPGCGWDRQSKLMGRWYNGDVSIRFRENGSVLYNSLGTGLVEGIYRYDHTALPISSIKPVKNLTVWLPQPGKTLELDFELRYLGESRIQLRPLPKNSGGDANSQSLAVLGVILKKSPPEASDADGWDKAPPIASANPER